jgi:5-methyltetrahydropteroyltriglutamate--homocysteine methyltransferase
MKPPFRADQVGSLLRPAGFAAIRRQGDLEAQRDTIRRIVAKQEAIGLEGITDGELSRDWWHLDFMAQLEGVTVTQNPGPKFGGTEEQPPIPAVTGKLRYRKPIMLEDFAFLQSVTRKTAKFTIPSPSMLHLRGGRASIASQVYPRQGGLHIPAAR